MIAQLIGALVYSVSMIYYFQSMITQLTGALV